MSASVVPKLMVSLPPPDPKKKVLLALPVIQWCSRNSLMLSSPAPPTIEALEVGLIEDKGVVTSATNNSSSSETTTMKLMVSAPAPPIRVELETPPEALMREAPDPLRLRFDLLINPVKMAVSAPAPPRRVEDVKAAAEMLSLPAPAVRDESLTPAKVKVSLESPEVMVLLTTMRLE